MPPSGALDRYEQILADLDQGEAAPIYLLYGPERWLWGKLKEAVRRTVLGKKGGSLNHDRFMADEVSCEVVASCVRTVPMLGRKRLVEVSSVEKWSTAQLAELEPLLSDFPGHACLLLTGDQVDGRLKTVKQMAKLGVVAKMESPDRRQLGAFLRRAAVGHGITLDMRVASLMVELVGRDLGMLLSALEKACLYAAGESALTERHIMDVVADTRQGIIFELTDALGVRSLDGALEALRRLMGDQEPPQRILVMLARQVRLLLMARQAIDEGLPPSRLAEHLKLHAFVAQKLASQVHGFTQKSLRLAFQEVAGADLALKMSRADAQIVLERLLLKIIGYGRA